MPNYRRRKSQGGSYFFTLVTHGRRKILTSERTRKLLRESIHQAQSRRAFDLPAIVLLPDHLYMIMRLPSEDADFSQRLGAIKYAFTRSYLAGGGGEGASSPGRKRHRNRGVWQKRFYEHLLRDYEDFRRHLDYIHINPVKHGLADAPADWPYSTFRRYVRRGAYEVDWCGNVDLPDAYVEPDGW